MQRALEDKTLSRYIGPLENKNKNKNHRVGRLLSRDERGLPLTQYIKTGEYLGLGTITHFKHHHRVLRLISNRMSE